MIPENTIINKVAESSLTTINLEDYYPRAQITVFDLKQFLFMGLIIKEKDFRSALQAFDWKQFENQAVAVTCTADAVIPMWAFMLVANYLQPVAAEVYYGDEKSLFNHLFLKNLSSFNVENFKDKRIVIKGCGDKPIPESAYMEITSRLRPVVKSIMYGEPCSTVPVYKRKD